MHKPSRTTALGAATLMAVTLLLAASFGQPVQAAPSGQWWVGGDMLFTEPTNLNSDVAFKFDPNGFSGGEVLSHDFDTELSGRIRGGWKNRDATENSFSVSYWVFSSDSSLDGRNVQPIVTDALFGKPFAETVESDMDLDVSILDVMLSRRLTATRNSAWFWGIGVRRAEMEQNLSVDYLDPLTFLSADPNVVTFDPNTTPTEAIKTNVDVDGIGLTAAIGATFSWHPRWKTHARVQFAMLKGETTANWRDRGWDDFFSSPPTFQVSRAERTDDRVFQQLELEAKVGFTVLSGFDLYLGYWLMNWQDVVQVDRFTDDFQGGFVSAREDLSLDGIVVGGSFTWE